MVNDGLWPTEEKYQCWLVVSTPLKNISQLGLLFPIYGKIKNVPNHQAEWEFQDPKIEVR